MSDELERIKGLMAEERAAQDQSLRVIGSVAYQNRELMSAQCEVLSKLSADPRVPEDIKETLRTVVFRIGHVLHDQGPAHSNYNVRKQKLERLATAYRQIQRGASSDT